MYALAAGLYLVTTIGFLGLSLAKAYKQQWDGAAGFAICVPFFLVAAIQCWRLRNRKTDAGGPTQNPSAAPPSPP
jgi:hypothetical protein